MLAALARAVRGYQRDNQIADDRPIFIQVERHGREDSAVTHSGGRADLTRTVGWFTTIAPVRVDPAVDAVHAVKAAKEELAGQPDLGAGFGALRFGPIRNCRGGPCRASDSTSRRRRRLAARRGPGRSHRRPVARQ